MDISSKIYVAGHGGLVGSALMRRLRSEGYRNLVVRTSTELDLRRQAAVEEFFRTTYEAGADNGRWNRATLEPTIRPDRPPRRPWSTVKP